MKKLIILTLKKWLHDSRPILQSSWVPFKIVDDVKFLRFENDDFKVNASRLRAITRKKIMQIYTLTQFKCKIA